MHSLKAMSSPAGQQSIGIGRAKQERLAMNQALRKSCSADWFYGLVTSNTRLSGDGPKDGHVTTPVWFTPGLDQSHTPFGKIVLSRAISAGVNVTV